MGGCVVCGFDETSGSRSAASIAARLARDLDLRAVLVHVLPAAGLRGRLPARALGSGRHAYAALKTAAEEHCFPERTSMRARAGDPASTLLAVAQRSGAELIVVGAGGSAVSPDLIGGVAATLMRDAPCPVVVVPRDAIPPLDSEGMRGVVCGVAGDAADPDLLRLASELAGRLGGRLHDVRAPNLAAVELDRAAERHGAGLIITSSRLAVELAGRGRTAVVVIPETTGAVRSTQPAHAG